MLITVKLRFIVADFMEIDLLLRGLVFGLAIAAPVGPIGVLCIRQTLSFGWLRGFVCGLGAATADGIYGCIAGLGLTFISDFLFARQPWLRLIGGIFLCYLGIKTFMSDRLRNNTARLKNPKLAGVYISTLFLTLSNPATILAFAAIFSGISSISTEHNYFSAMILVVGVFLGSALWWLILCICMSSLSNKLALSNLRWINRISGTAISVFGLIAVVSIPS
jgi:threonine/homoserine/homoserine lactone efflux protein